MATVKSSLQEGNLLLLSLRMYSENSKTMQVCSQYGFSTDSKIFFLSSAEGISGFTPFLFLCIIMSCWKQKKVSMRTLISQKSLPLSSRWIRSLNWSTLIHKEPDTLDLISWQLNVLVFNWSYLIAHLAASHYSIPMTQTTMQLSVNRFFWSLYKYLKA